MSRAVKKHRFWLIPLCMLIAGIISFYGWQQLHAQDMAQPPGVAGVPGVPGAPGVVAPPAPPTPSEPTLALSSVLPGGAKTTKTKNWDGTVTEFVRFKYKTLDERTLTVVLPATYKKEKMSKAAWDTLFQVFAMDYEYQLEAIEKNSVPDVSAFIGELMKEIQGQIPAGTFSSPSPASQAMEFARRNLPSIYGGSIALPPLLPGMM